MPAIETEYLLRVLPVAVTPGAGNAIIDQHIL